MAGDRWQRSEDRGQKTEDRRQKTEDSRQRTEDRITEVKGQMSRLEFLSKGAGKFSNYAKGYPLHGYKR